MPDDLNKNFFTYVHLAEFFENVTAKIDFFRQRLQSSQYES